MLGASTGGDDLHYLLEDPFAGGGLSDAFLHAAEHQAQLRRWPAVRRPARACYAQGTATRWSAQRIRAEFAEFDPAAALDGDGPLLFTGEMIYPWMFDYRPGAAPAARGGGRAGRARATGPRSTTPPGWPPTTSRSRPPCTSMTCTCRPSSRCRPRRRYAGLKAWVTNEYEHDGLRASSGAVLDRLLALARGSA